MPMFWKYVIIAVAGYLLGSFSFGLLIARLRKGPDLRTVGSGNTGATNVTRSMGLLDGLFTFLGDVIKAVAACVLGQQLAGGTYGAMLGGLCAVIGHNWPVYHGFRGGKGAASTCGVALFCFPVPALISFAFGVLGILLTGYVSVGSMLVVTVYAAVLMIRFWGNWLIIAWSLALAALLFLRHRENIRRLLSGTERKFSISKKSAADKQSAKK